MRSSRSRVTLLLAGLLAGGVFIQARPVLAQAAGQVVPGGTGVPAQQPEVTPAPRTFGTSTVVHTIPAHDFTPFDAAVLHTGFGLFGARGCTLGGCTFAVPIMLPAGASVTSVEAEVHDSSAGHEITVRLDRSGSQGSPFDILATGNTVGTPGDTTVVASLTTPETIDNVNFQYFAEIELGSGGFATLRVFALRVFYNLQVSPAPAVATFGDVPTTHLFHQFIEALAVAGITAGCSAAPPLYCPDAPVTRGQMAVFLSRALGLHFAP